MALNPMNLLKLKDRFGIFQRQHPKFVAFCKAVNQNALEPGAVMAVKFTSTDGKEYETNIRLTQDDVDTIRMFQSN